MTIALPKELLVKFRCAVIAGIIQKRQLHAIHLCEKEYIDFGERGIKKGN